MLARAEPEEIISNRIIVNNTNMVLIKTLTIMMSSISLQVNITKGNATGRSISALNGPELLVLCNKR
jgi:hypothetical protein